MIVILALAGGTFLLARKMLAATPEADQAAGSAASHNAASLGGVDGAASQAGQGAATPVIQQVPQPTAAVVNTAGAVAPRTVIREHRTNRNVPVKHKGSSIVFATRSAAAPKRVNANEVQGNINAAAMGLAPDLRW